MTDKPPQPECKHERLWTVVIDSITTSDGGTLITSRVYCRQCGEDMGEVTTYIAPKEDRK